MNYLKKKREAQHLRLVDYFQDQKIEYCEKKEGYLPTRLKQHGWLYLYRSNGFLKAGRTCHVSTITRRKQHERDYGEPMKLVTRRFCMYVQEVERELHYRFDRYKDRSILKADFSGTRECYFPSCEKRLVKFINETSLELETELGSRHF
jgi:hypothetical protein